MSRRGTPGIVSRQAPAVRSDWQVVNARRRGPVARLRAALAVLADTVEEAARRRREARTR